jgi:hypothetical protein
VFPGNREGLHPLFTLTAFVSAGFAALLTATIQTVPFRYVSRLLGVVILAALAVGMVEEGTPVFYELSDGGGDRWIAYPALLWLMALGGFLASAGRSERLDTNEE